MEYLKQNKKNEYRDEYKVINNSTKETFNVWLSSKEVNQLFSNKGLVSSIDFNKKYYLRALSDIYKGNY